MLLDPGRAGPPPVHEPLLDGLEPNGVEQFLEQLAAVLVVGPQELRELPWGSSTTWKN